MERGGEATAGYVMGIITTILMILAVLAVVLVLVLFVAVGSSSG